MKILAVNFLRLGDILMMNPILNALKKEYPEAQIHHVCFKEFEVASQVMTNVDQWHFLSRGQMFRLARENQESFFAPADEILHLVGALNLEGYDQVINMSHTRFSALFCGLIQSNVKLGTWIENDVLKTSSSIFMDFDREEKVSEFHYLDWYLKGFGIDPVKIDWRFGNEDVDVNPDLDEGRNLYLFQVLTSDGKKAWSEEKWLNLFSLIRRRDPLAKMKMICAPFEKDLLKDISSKSSVEVLGLSLAEVCSWIRKSQYFVTLDTSTKHLANDSSARVIELCLGSADFKKQGIYKSNSIILFSREACYPCPHEGSCHKVARSCVEGIQAEDVAQAIDFLNGRKGATMSCGAVEVVREKNWKVQPVYGFKGEGFNDEAEIKGRYQEA